MSGVTNHLLSRKRGGRCSEQRIEEVLKISLQLSQRYYGRFLSIGYAEKYKRKERQKSY